MAPWIFQPPKLCIGDTRCRVHGPSPIVNIPPSISLTTLRRWRRRRFRLVSVENLYGSRSSRIPPATPRASRPRWSPSSVRAWPSGGRRPLSDIPGSVSSAQAQLTRKAARPASRGAPGYTAAFAAAGSWTKTPSAIAFPTTRVQWPLPVVSSSSIKLPGGNCRTWPSLTCTSSVPDSWT